MLDISDRTQLERALRDLSLTDDLTGLYNRRGFSTMAERHLALAVRRRQPLLLIFADVDGLKRINDTHGHAAGDQALRDTASVLRSTYRSADIIARLGGDEFTVFPLDAAGSSQGLLTERLDEALVPPRTRSGAAVSPVVVRWDRPVSTRARPTMDAQPGRAGNRQLYARRAGRVRQNRKMLGRSAACSGSRSGYQRVRGRIPPPRPVTKNNPSSPIANPQSTSPFESRIPVPIPSPQSPIPSLSRIPNHAFKVALPFAFSSPHRIQWSRNGRVPPFEGILTSGRPATSR